MHFVISEWLEIMHQPLKKLNMSTHSSAYKRRK